MKQLADRKHMENDCFPRTLKFEMPVFGPQVCDFAVPMVGQGGRHSRGRGAPATGGVTTQMQGNPGRAVGGHITVEAQAQAESCLRIGPDIGNHDIRREVAVSPPAATH
jgi:hypothetical protein